LYEQLLKDVKTGKLSQMPNGWHITIPELYLKFQDLRKGLKALKKPVFIFLMDLLIRKIRI